MAGTESTEETFRVRVSLERFFGDERARCYVSVRGCRRVRWLARRLRRLFPLPRRLALISRGHLLPPDEPLALLQPDDPVEVIPATVELDQIDGNTQSATDDVIKASTPVSVEPSASSKRRRKDQKLGGNNDKLPGVMDISITLPISTGNDTHIQESEKLTHESELPGKTRSDYKREKRNKHLFFDDSNSQETRAAQTESTEIEDKEQDSTGLSLEPESDTERMRLLKEQALAVLEQVAARPRRRVRVRRRRKRQEPLPELPCAEADSAPEPPPGATATIGFCASSPNPVSAPDPIVEPITEVSRRDDESTAEDTTDVAPPVTVSVAEIEVDDVSRQDSQSVPPVARAAPAPAVLRNSSAAPRAARLVRSLVDVAPV